ncbi:MAG: ZIP family metal transporter [Candidatus Sericytochromatia bacterium]|nr:ZIP family metal transporter [Candidatus Sericytochromatia bacterium]
MGALPTQWWFVPMLGGLMAAGGWGVIAGHGSWLNRNRLGSLLAIGGGYLVPLALVDLVPEALERAGGRIDLVMLAVAGGALAVFALDRLLGPWLQVWADRLVRGHRQEEPCQAALASQAAGETHAWGHAHAHHLAHGHAHGHVHEERHAPGVAASCSAIGCLWLCALFDGQVLASSLQAGGQVGGLVGLGLLLHLLPEGIMAALLSLSAGHPPRVARTMAGLTGAVLVLGAGAQWLLASGSPWMLPFSAGVLLYFALTELLPSAAAGARGVVEVLSGAAAFGALHAIF